jgi:ABC-type sugar transport system substrate-binding protein
MNAGASKVAVVPHMLKDQPWGVRFRDDLMAALAVHPEVTLELADPAGDPVVQLHLVERYLQAGVRALIVAPLDNDILKPVLRGYQLAKIPVIVLDSDPGEPSLYRSLIIADNRQFGRKIGEFFAEVTDGVAELVEIRGMPTTSGARDRSAGFREAIAPYPGIRIVESVVGSWLYARAREEFGKALGRHTHLDGVFAQNDEMARGAWDAAHAAGRDAELLITGIDALRGEHGLQLVLQGKLAATLINPPPGRAAADALLAVLRNEPCMQRTVLQTSMFRSKERIKAWQEARAARRGKA